MDYNWEFFEKGLDELHIELDEHQKDQFQVYYEFLLERNKVMNLTAITEFDEVVEKHFLDSLCIVKALPSPGEKKILDLGSGAGFPGIPIKIAFPSVKMVLMDSLNKRIRFLDEVCTKLELNQVCAVHARAEEAARQAEYREEFDLCLSRAVANLSTLCEYCLPFVTLGGTFVSYKSSNVKEELAGAKKAASLLGARIGEVHQFEIPGTKTGRTLISIEKIRHTPKSYPRRAGIPGKTPLS